MIRIACCLAVLLALAPSAKAADGLDALAADAACLVKPNSVVRLSSPTAGTVGEVFVRRGDTVTAGQPVARLRSEVDEANYELARMKAASDIVIRGRKADRDNAYSKLARTRELAERKISSQEALKDAETAAVVADLAIEEAEVAQKMADLDARRLKALLDQRTILSPVTGVVTRADIRAGEYADPTVPIAVISENRPLRVELYLAADAYPLVATGAAAKVTLLGPVGGTYPATVAAKDAEIDAGSGTFMVSLELPNPDGAIPSGLRCTVHFTGG